VTEQILAVFVVLGLMIGALWVLRRGGVARFGGISRNRRVASELEIVDRISLTPQHSLHLVRLAGRTVLIGVSPAGLERLAELEPGAISGSTVGRKGFE